MYNQLIISGNLAIAAWRVKRDCPQGSAGTLLMQSADLLLGGKKRGIPNQQEVSNIFLLLFLSFYILSINLIFYNKSIRISNFHLS